MDKKLKFGIIGCSSISERSIIPSIQKSNFAELEKLGWKPKLPSREAVKLATEELVKEVGI